MSGRVRFGGGGGVGRRRRCGGEGRRGGGGRAKPQGERGDELWHGPGDVAADVSLAKFAEGLCATGGDGIREFANEHAVEGEGVGWVEGGEAAVSSDGDLCGAMCFVW